MRKRVVRQRFELKRQQDVKTAWKILHEISNVLTVEKIRNNDSLLDQHRRGLERRLIRMRIPNHKTLQIYKQYTNFIKNHKRYTEYALMQLASICNERLKTI